MILGPVVGAPSGPSVLIVGASTRAAAFSALRAGLVPVCCDQFADADLQAVATVVSVGSDPLELAIAADQFPGLPVIYTGGLENHPEVIQRLSQDRPVWGMPAEVVRKIRNPQLVAEALATARLPYLEIRTADSPPPADDSWLLKPLGSAGGRGIYRWNESAVRAPTLQQPHYFQRRLEGNSYSGVFLAQGSVGDVRFVGLTEQIIGEPALNGGNFSWCGNIGPAALDIQIESSLRRIANYLKWKFKLHGVFGIDFIVSPDGQLGLTEVNPRYPASVELLEFITGLPLLRDHVECFTEIDHPAADWTATPGSVLGKAVLYSPADAKVNSSVTPPEEGFREWPRIADIPSKGTSLKRGDPILSVFARGASLEEVRQKLHFAAARVLPSPQSPTSE
ncbi:MAG: ATP-grasp domain-containing protein [Planctomycetaceae bacterium]